ncbi:PhzF family phenazine biosynthesis protein [Caldimonas thermodepolymerans]|jgi:PhzF family phenazine biosynthesis protein|uniref:PhzF family phenazine biosynthesis protein n=1 Tax=Caldimonas thermodepolymerans TaxID=215580 RepID=UPI0022358601|nr:PhzF family phenazine biosynthesis protein [Caldimonas thermodepolymerans]UZG44031.1 PhzF family phenazine biosynthesis protein [Caldimonas thermodepolymerans]
MTRHAFKQVDVFTTEALKGNPVAVVFGADDLSDAQMQAFARWTNLSETTFLLRPTQPGADYRLRIFTPGSELPFAGHPTLGSCHAWLEAGGRPQTPGQVVQECGVGRVTIRQDGARLAFAAPPMAAREVEPALLRQVLAALGLDAAQVLAARWLDNGPKWLALHLASAREVLAIEPDFSALAKLAFVGAIGAYPPGSEAQYEVRAFVPGDGIPEDPVTGSLNASLAQWLIGAGVAPRRYVAAQGTRLQRAGRVHIEADGDTVWVGGACRTCIDGSLSL